MYTTGRVHASCLGNHLGRFSLLWLVGRVGKKDLSNGAEMLVCAPTPFSIRSELTSPPPYVAAAARSVG